MSKTDLFTLGELYVSDFLKPDEQPRAEPFELKLTMDNDTRVVQLSEVPPPELMWGTYWYRSGTNATMNVELAGIVHAITSKITMAPGDAWVDIASNDGTLLKHVSPQMYRVGIDPADETFRAEAEKHANVIVQEPFSIGAASRGGVTKARVITCIAMFYDLPDPTDFLADVYELLRSDGLFVLQMSYTPLMLQQLAFDNICHEHARYYTMRTLLRTLELAGLRVIDAELNDVNGGSFRVYATRDDADPAKFGSRPARDVAQMRVQSLLAYEHVNNVNEVEVWLDFYHQMERLKTRVRTFIRGVRDQGGTVWGYGASTKGNTLLQYFGLTSDDIDGIAERSPYKYGLRTVGTNIPIYSEDEMRAASPDYMLVLPWHFINEFVAREQDYLQAGGKFIVPCPQFQVISA